MSDVSVKKAVDGVLKKSGVKTSECMRSHAWRKGFKSICEQSGMKSINVEMLLGHDIGVSGHYYRPTESDLLEDYMTHGADALTINETNRLRTQISQLQILNQKSMKEFHDEWLSDLKNNYALIPQREWETIKGEMKAIKEHILPEYYEHTGKPIHLDANYSDDPSGLAE